MPRAGLSRAAVTEIAVQLVDGSDGVEGFGALTLAAVAAKAGVAVPSLYKHVGSLAELRIAVSTVAVTELGRRSAAATVGRAGGDALRSLGWAIRDFAREHPGLYQAAQLAPDLDDPSGLELAQAASDTVAIVGAVLRGFGLPDDRTVDAVRVARSAIHGFVMLERGGGFGMPDDVDRSFDALLDVVVAGVSALAESRR